ncbi:AMP-binding protein, partial [Mycobacterium sp.]|uniref:AMP-binding protein n=1 Tax=Mycobacterium sp. TaxID=1785 RepID=UPI003C70D821
MGNADGYLKARELLLELRTDYAAARDRFEWPRPEEFNWALDFFDVTPKGERDALILLEDDGSSTRATFDEMRARSNQVANMLRDLGIKRGDRILLMLGNEIPLWETMLAAIKLGAVLIPSSTLLHPDDIADRIERGEVRAVVADSPLHDRFPAGDLIRVSVGEDVESWTPFSSASSATSAFKPDGPSKADDLLLLYFTSGT